MKRILIIMGRYLPGYKDGGPVRSIKNLTEYLGNEYEFRILTCDRDHGDKKQYPNIKRYEWNDVGNAKVYYVGPRHFTKKIIKKLAVEVDLVYVCGCFNDYARNTLLLKKMDKIKAPVVIAAMGLFSPLAIARKKLKKKIFIHSFRMLGLFKNVYWSATSKIEVEDICREIKTSKDKCYIAEDLPRTIENQPGKKIKQDNNLKVVWISRISPEKNLLGAIDVISRVKSNIEFTIYGNAFNKDYCKECLKKLELLPTNIHWSYENNIKSEKVVEMLSNQHVFLLLTIGENYGHVISEALSAGCQCVISDKTPWTDLEKENVGKVIPLNDIDSFVQCIEEYASKSEAEINELAYIAYNYARKKAEESVKKTGYRRIFEIE